MTKITLNELLMIWFFGSYIFMLVLAIINNLCGGQIVQGYTDTFDDFFPLFLFSPIAAPVLMFIGAAMTVTFVLSNICFVVYYIIKGGKIDEDN